MVTLKVITPACRDGHTWRDHTSCLGGHTGTGLLWKRMEYFQQISFLMQEKTRTHFAQGNVLEELCEETSHELHHHPVSKILKY